MPGSMPATSQLEWLSSTTAMIVLFWSRATRDLLKACPGESRGRSAGASRQLHRLDAATKLPLFLVARPIASSGSADDARLLADLYAHNASRQMPQKGSSDQTVACFRRLGAGVVGSAAVCAFRFRPPGTGSKKAGWRRSGAFFGAVCFEPASRARLRFKAVMRSMTGGGAA